MTLSAEIQAGAVTQPRVLVVDDNEDLATSLAMVLAEWGCNVRTAENGYAAINVCEIFNPHIVISDLCMPGMNGFDLARRLRGAYGARIYLMAVTANDSDEFRTQASAAGFDEFRGKPIDLAEFCGLLQSKMSH